MNDTVDDIDYAYEANKILNNLQNAIRDAKYKIALNFINKLLFPVKKKNYKSLKDIRYIYEEDIVDNYEHNKSVVEEFKDIILKEFKIKYNDVKNKDVKGKKEDNINLPIQINTSNNTELEIDKKYILTYISKILKKLDYNFERCLKYKKPTYNIVRIIS